MLRALSIFYIIISCALLGQSCRFSDALETPKVERGTIDLTNWDFERDGVVKLNGDWEFYWNSFLMDLPSTARHNIDPGYLFVPGLWNNKQINEITLPGHGYASYRLKIRHNIKDNLSIRYLNAATSGEIFVDGVSLFRSGVPGKTIESTYPSYKPGTFSFSPQGETVEIVVQIANFHHKKGGQWEPLILGTTDQISQYKNRQVFIELLSIGGIFIMALFHLIIFMKHTYEKPLLYFGIFAFLISVKFLVSSEFTIYMFTELRWMHLVRIDYLSFYLAILFFLFFFRSLFPKETYRWFVNTIIVVSLLFSASVLILPLNYFSYGMLYFQIFTIVGGSFVFVILIQAIKHKREGSHYFLYGFIMLFVCMVHDIMKVNEMVYSISLVPVGLPLFILFQALILSTKIRKALFANEKLTIDLQQQNDEYLQLNNMYKIQNEQLKIAKEKAEESDRFKSAFLANISHEIRTPMNGILGFAELLGNDEISEAKKSWYLSILKERGHHLLGVINDIIDVSRIETGHIDLRKDTTNINALFSELFDSYYHACKKKQIKLIRNAVLPDSQSIMLVDKQKLRQILDNLLSNAIKFTNSGEVEFGYLVVDNMIEFNIRDTGIGMSEREIAVIFDRFNQANKNISRRYGGTGLGLSIVKAYVEKMGGQIVVQSQPGEGSVFKFFIPYEQPLTLKTEKAASMSDYQHSKQNLTIMLVEDNMTNAFLMQEILQLIKADVLLAKNGTEAIDIYRSDQHIDLVLMDIKLPDTNGYDLTRVLKTIRENIPIIAQTAYALLGDKEKALEAGCVDYLPKPIDSKELFAKINRYTTTDLNS